MGGEKALTKSISLGAERSLALSDRWFTSKQIQISSRKRKP